MSQSNKFLPYAFISKKLHAISGLALVLFILEHLFTNSKAAFFWQGRGNQFVEIVNSIHNLVFLKVIEITFIALPLIYHGALGVFYTKSAKFNIYNKDKTKPSLGRFNQNKSYTLQRITSWVLLFGIVLHILQMRILEHPELYLFNGSPQYLSKVSMDDSLLAIASYWGVNLIDKEELEVLKKQILSVDENDLLQDLNQNLQLKETLAKQKIQYEQNVCYIKAIEYFQFNENELVASCPSFGVAVLLIVRQTFKSPLMMTLYAIFVLSASFHAFNGLWTALISLGLLSNMTMQKIWLKVCLLLMFLSIFWGFISIFGSYWLVF